MGGFKHPARSAEITMGCWSLNPTCSGGWGGGEMEGEEREPSKRVLLATDAEQT